MPDPMTRHDLAQVFERPADAPPRMGLRVSVAVLDPTSGGLPPDADARMRATLDSLCGNGDWQPNAGGLRRDDGARIAWRDCAVEYDSALADDVASLMSAVDDDLRLLAAAADRQGVALVPGANHPFHDTPIPLTTELGLDYTDAADLRRKLHAQVVGSAVATALFVNSPLTAGRWNGLLSGRLQGRVRCGVLDVGLREEFTIADFVDWAVGLRPEGVPTTRQDWLDHLSSIPTDVRLDPRLTLSAVDGPGFPLLGTVPAFWVGLTYDAASCEGVWELLCDVTAADCRTLMNDVALRGMRAQLRGRPVADFAGELVWLAQQGMVARIKKGLERPSALSMLDPLAEITETGTTFAEQCLRRWHGELREAPDRYVRAYRVPVD